MTATRNPSPNTMIPDSRSLKDRESGTDTGTAERALQVVRVWEQTEPSPRRYVVAGLVPEGAITALYGDGGNGKSYTALYIASCVALGVDVFNLPTTPGPSLFVDAELDEEEFTRRAYAVARGMGYDRPPKGLHYHRLAGSLTDPLVMADVGAIVDAVRPALTILDSVMAAAYGADLERAADTTTMLKQVERWGTVLTLDHIAKPQPGANLSQYRPYGSAFKYNLARSVLQVVQADGGGLVLRQTKHNFGPKATPLGIGLDFESDRVTFSVIDVNDERMAGIDHHLPAAERVYRALADYATGARPEELADEVEMSVKTVRNHLTVLGKSRRAVSLGDGKWRVPTIPDSRLLRDRESGIGELGAVTPGVPLHSNGHQQRRCTSCGMPLSVVAAGDECGRCKAGKVWR